LRPAGVTAEAQSSSDTQTSATFAIANSVAPGNQAIQVTNTQSQTTSHAANFFVQVPKTLIRRPDYGTNGLGPVNTITDATVFDIYGNPIPGFTHQCGVYEIIGYQLVDQRTPAQNIYGNYTLHEPANSRSEAKLSVEPPYKVGGERPAQTSSEEPKAPETSMSSAIPGN
jgi:hypothetical protein